MRRLVQAETLDHLAPDDPQAIGSRADLMRLHRVMGTVTILRRAMRSWSDLRGRGEPIRILELGAGDGSLLLRLAEALAPTWPMVELTLMDRQALVGPRTITAFARLGWTVSVRTVDVLDWASEIEIEARTSAALPASPPAAAQHWHVVIANLFLHHFDTPDLARILRRVGDCSDRFLACEPRRAYAALAASHLVGAIGANAVTREDAVLSVKAGFRARELSAVWQGAPPAWQVTEYPAGLFSHCFQAQRRPPLPVPAAASAAAGRMERA